MLSQDSKSYDQKIEDLIRNRKEFGKKPLFDLLKEIGGLGCISWEMALFSKIGAVVGSAIFVGGVVVAACTWAWSIYSTRKEVGSSPVGVKVIMISLTNNYVKAE